jgi:two-component system response regulator PilR (NtrC family)
MKNDSTIEALNNATPEQLKLFLATRVITQEQYDAIVNKKSPCDEWLDRFISTYDDMKQLKEKVKKLSKVDDPVLIIGETGTGKELLARALHGDKKPESFIPVNCGAITETLIESELFGSMKGSFTGSIKDKAGVLEQAKDGTIFLDEIGDMPLTMQVKLLRAIQEKKIRRVGGDSEIPINCRFVFATHKDLEKNRGSFRDDLFYRISFFVLRPTPLSVRSRDIKPIVESIDEGCDIKDIDKFCALIDEDKLEGNVRSLQQIVRRYIVLGTLPHK